jgi:hypothetical protein
MNRHSGGLDGRASIPGRGKRFFSSPQRPAPLWGSLPGGNAARAWCVTTHLCLVLSSGMVELYFTPPILLIDLAHNELSIAQLYLCFTAMLQWRRWWAPFRYCHRGHIPWCAAIMGLRYCTWSAEHCEADGIQNHRLLGPSSEQISTVWGAPKPSKSTLAILCLKCPVASTAHWVQVLSLTNATSVFGVGAAICCRAEVVVCMREVPRSAISTQTLILPLSSRACWGGSRVPSCYCVLLMHTFFEIKPHCCKGHQHHFS